MIYRRGKRFGVRVYDPATQGQRWVGTFKTRREARSAEMEATRRPAQGPTEDCASFAIRWVDDYARPAAATIRTNRYAIKKFAEDFRGTPLADIDRPAARAWAKRTPQSNVRVVRAMFTDAINDGLHPGPNPFANLRLEQPRGGGRI